LPDLAWSASAGIWRT
jgi:transposase